MRVTSSNHYEELKKQLEEKEQFKQRKR